MRKTNATGYALIAVVFTYILFIAWRSDAEGADCSWCSKTRVDQEFTVKDKRGVRIGKIVTDHVRGGYKIQDTYGITRGRIETNKGSLTSDRYNTYIERKR